MSFHSNSINKNLKNKSQRSNQMNQQQLMIAKKKAEIEAKFKQEQELEKQSKINQAQSSPGLPLKAKKGLLGRNRWGFKGKKTNVVSNKEESKNQITTNTSTKPLDEVSIKQESSIKCEKDSIKIEPNTDQETSWYEEALRKAREIAQTSKSSTPLSKEYSNSNDNEVCTSVSAINEKSLDNDSSPINKKRSLTLDTKIELPTFVEELASLVAVNGEEVEIMVKNKNLNQEELKFLHDSECELYKSYRKKVEHLQCGFRNEEKIVKKRTRWGSEDDKVINIKPMVTGKPPELVSYAYKVFGTVDLEEHQWKQCEDQLKMSMVYQDMLVIQEENRKKELKAAKRQYEYDSDEDTEGGTWEHKARRIEMDKTAKQAETLTHNGEGKHHIGDFIPPDELNRFLAKYQAVKNGDSIIESDYQDNKIANDNKGFKMLQKMGWNEGSGLGTNQQGITQPINQGAQSSDKKGVGITQPHDLQRDDDEFDAYRKRMMLAYRFRPNPLNNPRRSYY